jgi:hypothetical protein
MANGGHPKTGSKPQGRKRLGAKRRKATPKQ